MYGVITCPRCGTVQGVDLSHAQAACVRCRNKIDVTRAVVHFSTDSPQELADAVRRFVEMKRGQTVSFPAPRGTAGARKNKETIESAIAELGRSRGEFTARDIAARLEVGGDELEEVIAALLGAGLMYEAGPGTYRAA